MFSLASTTVSTDYIPILTPESFCPQGKLDQPTQHGKYFQRAPFRPTLWVNHTQTHLDSYAKQIFRLMILWQQGDEDYRPLQRKREDHIQQKLSAVRMRRASVVTCVLCMTGCFSEVMNLGKGNSEEHCCHVLTVSFIEFPFNH